MFNSALDQKQLGAEGREAASPVQGGGGVNAQKSFWADMSSAGMRRAELWVF